MTPITKTLSLAGRTYRFVPPAPGTFIGPRGARILAIQNKKDPTLWGMLFTRGTIWLREEAECFRGVGEWCPPRPPCVSMYVLVLATLTR